jgi:hypothetical protein
MDDPTQGYPWAAALSERPPRPALIDEGFLLLGANCLDRIRDAQYLVQFETQAESVDCYPSSRRGSSA